jgi:hypothetical protein
MTGYTAEDIPALDLALEAIPGRWDSDVAQAALRHAAQLQRRECLEWDDHWAEVAHLTGALVLWLRAWLLARRIPWPSRPGLLALLVLALLVLAAEAVSQATAVPALIPVSGDTPARLLVIAPCAPPVPLAHAGTRG